MSMQEKNKRIKLTTRYSDATCVVTAYGFRKSSNEPWDFYLKDTAVKAAEKKLVIGDDCLMLTPAAAEIVGDTINVVSTSFGGCPIYATLNVKSV